MALRRALLQVAVLAALLLALAPAAALAAPRWVGAETLDPAGGQPDVTADTDGNSMAVWQGSGGEVFAASRDFGGPWRAPENLEPGGGGSGPMVVAQPDGEFVAVWAASGALRWAHRPRGGSWSAPDTIASSCCATVRDLVAGADGSVTVLWYDEGSPDTNTKPAGSDTWEATDFVTGGPDDAALAMAPDGSAAIAYPSSCESFYFNCVSALYRPPGGDWSVTPELAGQAIRQVTGVALTARPDAGYAVVWTEGPAPIGLRGVTPVFPVVRSADRPPGTTPVPTWGAPQTIAESPGGAAGCPSAFGCVDLATHGGTLAAVWQQGAGIAASVRSGDGAWGAAETVGEVGPVDANPQAALTADDTAVAAWRAVEGPTGGTVVRGAHRHDDGSWDEEDLGRVNEGSAAPLDLGDVMADGQGDAVAAWRDADGERAAGFDSAGPFFTAFSLPSGRQNEPLPFSAAAVDNWSGPPAISWLFGDGGSADGGAVEHAYGAGGNYDATATATDTSGNAAQLSGPVDVAVRDEVTPTPTPTATPTPDACGTTDRDQDGVGDGCDRSDGSRSPVAFKTFNATVVSGDVFVKPPAGAARAARARTPKGFRRLQGAETLRVGSTLDTAKGRVLLRSAADTRHHVQLGQFFRGRFVVRQVRKPRGRAKRRSKKLITELRLSGSSFSKACRKTKTASASARRRSKKRVRRLFGDGKGSFRTRGRNAAATVRGTRWGVQDRCDGTLVTVQRGRVSVRDLVKHRTVLVRTGHTYLARRR